MNKNTGISGEKIHLTNEDIDIVQMVIDIWKLKIWIILGTLLFTAVGLYIAQTDQPIYHSEAIIAPKEKQKSSDPSSVLSQFGGLGGMVAPQLGIGDNSMNKMEIILKGHEIAESVIGGSAQG